ncbi:MAG: TonB-dependent receptor, partial [Pontixanthobacter sp.]
QNGTVGFGATFFGNCCRRSYDLDYNTNAPFASVGVEFGDFNVDGSLRYDFGSAEGTVTGADLGGGRVGVTSFDFDNDGNIDPAEVQTSVLPLTNPAPVDYDYDYVSYSLGVNYRIQPDLSVFARYSKGGRANADRLLFNASNVSPVDGSLTDNSIAVDFVKQAELGVKYRSGGLAVYATGFYAETEEQNFEATTQRVFNREYEAKGLEVEGSYAFGNGFSLSASGTYTDSEIKRDSISPDNEGNTPRRQADFIYQATAKYDAEMFGLGANIVGTTDSFAQDSNQLVLPGFAQVNAFVNVRPMENLEVALHANNLFNVSGFTEAEEGSIPGNNIVRARSINGRTVSASVRVSF